MGILLFFHLSFQLAIIFMFVSCVGKLLNGASMVVDGGLWMSPPRPVPKDTVRQLSRAVEKRSREAPVEVPRSKL